MGATSKQSGLSPSSSGRFKKAYEFLVDHEQRAAPFTKAELSSATGWKAGTIKTYLSKKWSKIVKAGGASLKSVGVAGYKLDEFTRLMSQRDDVSGEPRKPPMQPEVEALLRKARESALLALQIYNNPTVRFRTEGFAVMMIIAWTALCHAIFQRRGTTYFYTDPATGSVVLIDGDAKAWELAKCLEELYGGDYPAARRNLAFFIKLRNRIEHRFVPEIDPMVSGECQSLLFNFDELLVAEFGAYFALRETLAVPLQTAHVRTDATVDALRALQARYFDEVRAFIVDFRTHLPAEVLGDQRFRFSVYLIPKPANHAPGDLAVEFVKVTPENESKLAELTSGIVAIRERPVANADSLKASDVVKAVAERVGKPFNRAHHIRAWKRYQVRRPLKKGGRVSVDGCNTAYCIPDKVHNDYVFTPAWVDFLVVKLADEKEYGELTKNKVQPPPKPSAR